LTEPQFTPPRNAESDVAHLVEPTDGVPAVVNTPEALADAIERLQAGTGPVAVDAERAHGFRYSQRAYLVQLRRGGAGTHLVDPIAFGQPADLSQLAEAIADAEWVIHAASQDLPCLTELKLIPRHLFDTELAARLLGHPRVALGTMLEQLFGVRLRKEYSASDWSMRPLPAEWLAYAALDVELLLELRDRLAGDLMAAGKWDWAREEFAALVANAGRIVDPRPDPWRRTSGIHKVRTRRGLAYVAELWRARDRIAQQLDRAPGRILPDMAISDLAAAGGDRSGATAAWAAMRKLPAFQRKQAKRFEPNWVEAVQVAASLRESELPPLHLPGEGPPHPRLWANKSPAAAERLTAAREALAAQAEILGVPLENLLTPDHVRRLAWQPPIPTTTDTIDAALTTLGARRWQRRLTTDLLANAFAAGDAPA
jgi:ribonuclease D